jgi:5,10-methylenetetrahydrofolate reductase
MTKRPHQTDENPAGIDLPLEPLPGHSSLGRLERVLRRGEFAVTAELNPPDSANAQDVYERAAVFDGWVDGINAVDASGANCHMSSVGICALLTRMGYAPIMQIACRDRNRIAIQGDVLGASAMGVANILCLTGDGVQAGDQPGAKPVFDLDCMSLLETIRTMRANSCPAASSRRRRRYSSAALSTLSRRPSISGRTGWQRRSRPARSSYRASTATTCRCSANT